MITAKIKTAAIAAALSFSVPAYAETPVTEPAVATVAVSPTTQTVIPPTTAQAISVLVKIPPAPVRIAASSSSVECLVKVMNHEAGGEGSKGQKAVGYVVLNRTKSGRFPASVCSVVYQRSQFSNINHARAIPANKYSQLKSLALNMLSSYSKSNDPTNGSLYFHNTHVSPSWRNLVRMVRIGSHIFYR